MNLPASCVWRKPLLRIACFVSWSSKESLAEGSVVVADFQTAGRGQIGNTWESEAGKELDV